ncbi:XkdX family protein [Clostridium botulinum]|uniref:XkdX family protein n=1 Tax=Clostridium botulinum TaxID=1491 RepID=UPI0009B1CC2E|nr:XkdX family protein [Clostridium botulinum]MBY6935301.1 XkdX family protein [Clostridium botulinum]NFL82066.1 XkdX family protein [Clostridium botulinum]NFN12655.1 XkdX family protein [Clostridium botulinum]NFO38211.1 XkdX family protein [Clostridium botulinum]NFO44222.1 XkdX family protein [Clostridium botulinum]
MNWFEKVKRYFCWGCYNNADVWDFVSYKKITTEQYTEITKIEYTEQRPVETV